MRDQLAKLEKMSQDTNVVIQIMPLSATSHPGMEGPLRILEFKDSPSVWYTEGWYSGRSTETRDEVASAMTSLTSSARPPWRRMINKVMATIRSEHYGSADVD